MKLRDLEYIAQSSPYSLEAIKGLHDALPHNLRHYKVFRELLMSATCAAANLWHLTDFTKYVLRHGKSEV